MALTDVQIANLALSRIGTNKQLTSLGDGSPESSATNAVLNQVKGILLASHSWSWATLQVEPVEAELLDYDPADLTYALWQAALALLDVTELAGVPRPIDYSYVFYRPADCVTPIKLWPGTRAPGTDGRVPYACRTATYRVIDYVIVVDPDPPFAVTQVQDVTDTLGEVILTDDPAPTLFYVSNSTSLPRPLLFDQAVAVALAAELAMSIRNDTGLAAKLTQLAELATQRAIAHDLNGQQVDPPAESSFITARY